MALKITYTDKVSLVPSGVAAINEVSDDDMNEIKTCVNDNADDLDTAIADIVTAESDISTLKPDFSARPDAFCANSSVGK